MRLHRFYVLEPLGEELLVEQKELVHQWLRVFRYTQGDSVLLFNENTLGFDYTYTITATTSSSVSLSPSGRVSNILPSHDLALFMALVKKDTFETVVRQATELGITAITPVLSARSEKKSLNMDRLRSIAQEAAEQSGRGTVPVLHDICTFDDAAPSVLSSHIVCDGKGGAGLPEQSITALWVGPEGGWTDTEVAELTTRGAKSHSYGTPTLKADTAAITGIVHCLSSHTSVLH